MVGHKVTVGVPDVGVRVGEEVTVGVPGVRVDVCVRVAVGGLAVGVWVIPQAVGVTVAL
jgi:hypothetical protein